MSYSKDGDNMLVEEIPLDPIIVKRSLAELNDGLQQAKDTKVIKQAEMDGLDDEIAKLEDAIVQAINLGVK